MGYDYWGIDGEEEQNRRGEKRECRLKVGETKGGASMDSKDPSNMCQ